MSLPICIGSIQEAQKIPQQLPSSTFTFLYLPIPHAFVLFCHFSYLSHIISKYQNRPTIPTAQGDNVYPSEKVEKDNFWRIHMKAQWIVLESYYFPNTGSLEPVYQPSS